MVDNGPDWFSWLIMCFEIEIVLFVISLIILSLGIINYFIHKIMIFENKNNLGNYKSDYYV